MCQAPIAAQLLLVTKAGQTILVIARRLVVSMRFLHAGSWLKRNDGNDGRLYVVTPRDRVGSLRQTMRG